MTESKARRLERILRGQRNLTMKSSSFKIRSRRSSYREMPTNNPCYPETKSRARRARGGGLPVKHVFLLLETGRRGGDTSEGDATKSIEGSDWISLASSRMRRTPGDLVLRGMRWGDTFDVGGNLFISGGIAVSNGQSF